MNTKTNAETLALIKAAQLSGSSEVPPELMKAWTQPGTAVTGINAYDLEAPAKQLYPVITPLRNETPRVSGKGGIQANWRAVTGVNTTNMAMYLAGGKRGGVITTTTQDYTAAYKGIGLEDSVDFEADYAAEYFQDLKALAVEGLLRAAMIGEEKIILGGDNSMSLANTPTPVCTFSNVGGTLANQSYGVGCVAMTFEGYQYAKVIGGVVQSYTRTNADSSTDAINGGLALPSAQANVAVSAGNGTISASVTAVAGAMAYAWFWGANAANLTLGAITTINSVLITANATGTTVAPGTSNFAALGATNNSVNSLAFDGLLTFASQSALGSYQGTLATGTPGTGTPLTTDGSGGVTEIETALKSFWDNYRLAPSTAWVNSQEMKNITAKVVAASAANPLALRFQVSADQSMMAGGVIVREYLNRYAMDGNTVLKIRLHPNMPPGTILFTTDKLPYPLSNVTNILQVRTRRDYYQIEWPLRSRKYEYGVYADEVLQNFFPPSQGIITNIGNG
jgi:hypothetical protein